MEVEGQREDSEQHQERLKEVEDAEEEEDGVEQGDPTGAKAPDLLVAAFLSMQPASIVVSFVREVGGGYISELAQQFFLDRCFNNEVHLRYPSSQSYVKGVVKEIILAGEGDGIEVKEDLYELHSLFLASIKGMPLAERCHKTLCFIIPEDARPNFEQTVGKEVGTELIGAKLLTVRTSLNILDGDTGYTVWPAGLYLAEVLLSHPQLVHGRACLELGSGTGISGIWLSMLAPTKAVLTDGSLSALSNLRHNLAINGIPVQTDAELEVKKAKDEFLKVECRQLLWGTVSADDLRSSEAEVIIGADLIYDPTIVPYLVRVLAILLKRNLRSRDHDNAGEPASVLQSESEKARCPVAYLAAALRNLSSLHLFFKLSSDAGLKVVDVTDSLKPLKILPDMVGLDRSQIRLYRLVVPEVEKR